MSSRVAVKSWLPFVAAVLVGALLRGYQLDQQILVDDEWHSLDRNLNLGYWFPSVVYAAIEATIGLSDRMIQGFYFVFGVFLTAVLPVAAQRVVGWRAAAVYGWLLALSPFLVYYSRFARPYAVALLFSMVAVKWFLDWWQTRRKGFAVAYLVTVTGALIMHPLMAPFVFWPFVPRLLALITSPERQREDLRRLASVGIWVPFCVAASLAPMFYDRDLFFNTAGQSSRELMTLVEVFGVFFGSYGPMSLLMAAFAGVGLRSMLRTAPELCRTLLLGSILQIGTIFVVAPNGASSAFIFARYTIPVLAFVLLLAATGIVGVAKGLADRVTNARLATGIGVLVPGFVVAGLFANGPLLSSYRHPDSWLTSELHLKFTSMEDRYRRSVHDVSTFYRQLADFSPGSRTLIEVPWFSESHRNPYPLYQSVHRQHVLIGYPGPGFDFLWRKTEERRLASRRFVSLTDPEELQARADLLVIHKHLETEMTPLLANPAFDLPAPWEGDLEGWIRAARGRFGEAFFEDETLVVFRLAEVLSE